MKKILCTALAACFLFVMLTACGSKDKENAQENEQGGWTEDVFEAEPTETQSATQPVETQEATTPSGTEVATQPAETESATHPTQGQQPTTQPTSPAVTQPTEAPSTSQPTEAPTTEAPTESTTEPALDEATLKLAAEYEAYQAMSSAEKTAFRGTFANYDAFFAWHSAALEAHKQANPPIQIPPDGIIDLG